jgi:hypothetical protein
MHWLSVQVYPELHAQSLQHVACVSAELQLPSPQTKAISIINSADSWLSKTSLTVMFTPLIIVVRELNLTSLPFCTTKTLISF